MRITPNATDQSITVHICDSSGEDKTDLVYGDMTLRYRRGMASQLNQFTAVSQSISDAHTDGGFVHIQDGHYRVDLPDAAVATGADVVAIYVQATDAIQTGGATMIALENAPATAAAINTAVEGGQIGNDTAAILVDTADMQPKLGTPSTSISADIAAIEGAASISPIVVSETRTLFPDRTGLESANIIEVGENTAATFAVAYPLNEPGDRATLDSVVVSGAGTPTASDLSLNAGQTRGHFTLPALTPTGDYSILATATTVDGQTLKRTGTIRVS